MKIAGSLCVVLAGVATVVDQVTAVDQITDACPTRKVNHDDIIPFRQPEPKTIKEKAAVKFKPFLTISGGCESYPAVSLDGYVSGGLNPSGPKNGNCKGNKHGSQVYGRSEWYRGHWYIAYAFYFPKEQVDDDGDGHRHGWHVCVMWLDNPANKDPNIEGVSLSRPGEFVKHVPPLPYTVDGTHVKLRYIQRDEFSRQFEFESTELKGADHDLIMWHQLSDMARCALNNTNWNGVKMPINDVYIGETLRAANPF